MSNAWLENIKVGDKVIVDGSGFTAFNKIDTVERLTKTQIVLKNTHSKYRRSSGRSVGDIWNSSFLSEATREKILKIQEARYRLNLLNKIESISIRNLSTDSLKSIVVVIGEDEVLSLIEEEKKKVDSL